MKLGILWQVSENSEVTLASLEVKILFPSSD